MFIAPVYFKSQHPLVFLRHPLPPRTFQLIPKGNLTHAFHSPNLPQVMRPPHTNITNIYRKNFITI